MAPTSILNIDFKVDGVSIGASGSYTFESAGFHLLECTWEDNLGQEYSEAVVVRVYERSAASAQWFFGDGGVSALLGGQYTYNDPGLYTVGAILTGPFGETEAVTLTDWVEVTAAPEEPSEPGDSECPPNIGLFAIFRRCIKVRRTAEPTLDSATGRYTEGEESEIKINASCQPLSRSEIEFLPEGRREEHAYKIYTNTELRALQDGTNPDKVVIDGQDYEVYSRLPWANSIINHYKFLVMKVKES